MCPWAKEARNIHTYFEISVSEWPWRRQSSIYHLRWMEDFHPKPLHAFRHVGGHFWARRRLDGGALQWLCLQYCKSVSSPEMNLQ